MSSRRLALALRRGQGRPALFRWFDEAIATIRELFLLYRAGGNPLKALFVEIGEKPDGTWSMAVEYDYA